jgi:CDP-diacylglycerol--glycerol-3-phosphate 3-phosphatidyltransferase
MQTDQSVPNKQSTLTDHLRVRFKGFVEPIAAFLNRLGIHPNTLTLIGLLGNFIGAFFLSSGNFLVGGLIILAMGPFDALDGTMARLRGEPSDFGGFVDSVTDRYSELLIFGGLLIHYLNNSEVLLASVTFIAASGSVMVSYSRARAEGLGFEAKIGILTRVERFVILVPSLVLGVPWLGVGIVAIFANLTALQRIHSVWVQSRHRENN